jgi:DNA-directed RNA polymerase sigma subunit (sigma70/sigma32)
VPLLQDVTDAAQAVQALEAEYREQVDAARAELRRRIRLAHDEGIPLARIGRAMGVSRERARQLYSGD